MALHTIFFGLEKASFKKPLLLGEVSYTNLKSKWQTMFDGQHPIFPTKTSIIWVPGMSIINIYIEKQQYPYVC